MGFWMETLRLGKQDVHPTILAVKNSINYFFWLTASTQGTVGLSRQSKNPSLTMKINSPPFRNQRERTLNGPLVYYR